MKQMELRTFSAVESRHIVSLPDNIIAHCRTFGDAFRVALRESSMRRLPDHNQGRALGFDRSTMSMILSDKRAMHPEKIPEVEKMLGNRALSQFIWMRSNELLNWQIEDKSSLPALEGLAV